MIAATVLDVLLAVVLLALLVVGWRTGLAQSVGSILGLAAGGVAAYFLMPMLASIVTWPAWRVLLIVVGAVVLLVAGHATGTGIARAISRAGDERSRPGGVSRLLGGLLSVGAGALVVSLIAGGVAALGAPVFSKAAQQSVIIGGISRLTPEPVDAALTQLRGVILAQGMPQLDALADEFAGTDGWPPLPPELSPGHDASDPLHASTASIVRVAGTAYACGQNLTGSGVVIAGDRVVTNAHVVAGVDQPVIEAPNGQSLEGRVVYFDPEDDVAVIATAGLRAAPLALGDALEIGDAALVGGYPWGGPYMSSPAEVLAMTSEALADIYDGPETEREIYTLAVDVNPGNSGGPLLDLDGDIVGLVFATGAGPEAVGYALTSAELESIVDAADELRRTVTPGSCIRR